MCHNDVVLGVCAIGMMCVICGYQIVSLVSSLANVHSI